MLRRFRALRLLLAMLPLLALPCVGLADDYASKARDTAARLGVQDRLPVPDVAPPPRHDDERPVSFNLGGFGKVLLIVGAIALLGTVAYIMRDVLSPEAAFKGAKQPGDALRPVGGDAAQMDEAQSDADRLAALGRYAEAMHTLLLQALTELRGRVTEGFAASLTSREVARRVAITDAARSALAALVGTVEPVYFGHADAQEADYQTCRAHYAALVEALFHLPARAA